MGVNRFLATTIERVTELRRRPVDEPNGPISNEAATSPDEALEAARRRSERRRFDNDASYFDFLIARAVQSGTDTAPEGNRS